MCFGKKDQEADDEGARRNQEIEKALREDRKRIAREVKILLLGTIIWVKVFIMLLLSDSSITRCW